MRVYRGINWIADSVSFAPSERRAKWMHRKMNVVWLSEAFRSRFPIATMRIARYVNDVAFVYKGMLIVATHPRPYMQWVYDCLKSNIVVVAKPSERKEALERLRKEKVIALGRKRKLHERLRLIKPVLEDIYEKGYVAGMIGRGSYFDRNGYPSEHDDIDLVILVDSESKRRDEIAKILSHSGGDFRVILTTDKDRTIKKGSKGAPVFSFVVLGKDVRGFGGLYEKYVLGSRTGIAIRGLPKGSSEIEARRMTSCLSKDPREKLLKEGKLSVFPRKNR